MTGQTWSGQHWRVIAIDTESLGNRSYVVLTRDGAIAIDPPRDYDRVEAVLSDHGVDLDLVPAAADARLADGRDARLVLAVPARDVHPVTVDLAAALANPAEIVAVDP